MSTPKTAKRQNGRTAVEEQLAGATEKVLKQITDLYETGLSGGAPGAMGLKGIADSPLLNMPLRKPRKKITVMIVGNHSAGKSSFINWYIGENIQKTGVAIETRGFTFVTSGKKRETLTGEATVRFFDYLKDDFAKIDGILPNLFTEISTSKEKNFNCVDFIDTPGLVDGDMLYPFDVQEAIITMAEHVDLILIFFDPIGQATCKRTMQVVERLNNGPHLEKIHYFMSKADAVEKEHDRQRVLIQITQNLATRIRNSHAFNLPTFYLPREDGSASNIPNAIEDVCIAIDKAINNTVQKNLQLLKQDCERVVARVDAVLKEDREKKGANLKKRLQGSLFYLLAAATLALLGLLLTARVLPSVCRLSDGLCETAQARALVKLQPVVSEHFNLFGGGLLALLAVFLLMARFTWKIATVFSKKDIKKVEEYRQVTQKIKEQEADLYEQWFKSLANAER